MSAASRNRGQGTSISRHVLKGVFRILYQAQNYVEYSDTVFIAVIFIQWLQLINFPLRRTVGIDEGGAADALSVLRWISSLVSAEVITIGGSGAPVTAIYGIALAIFVVLAGLGIVALRESLYNETASGLPVRIFSYLAVICSTVLYIPIMVACAQLLGCDHMDASISDNIHNMCWESGHLALAIIGVLVMTLLFVVSLAVVLTVPNGILRPGRLANVVHTRLQACMIVWKLGLTLVYIDINSMSDWLLWVLLAGAGLTMMYITLVYIPYPSKVLNVLEAGLTTGYLWIVLGLFIELISPESQTPLMILTGIPIAASAGAFAMHSRLSAISALPMSDLRNVYQLLFWGYERLRLSEQLETQAKANRRDRRGYAAYMTGLKDWRKSTDNYNASRLLGHRANVKLLDQFQAYEVDSESDTDGEDAQDAPLLGKRDGVKRRRPTGKIDASTLAKVVKSQAEMAFRNVLEKYATSGIALVNAATYFEQQHQNHFLELTALDAAKTASSSLDVMFVVFSRHERMRGGASNSGGNSNSSTDRSQYERIWHEAVAAEGECHRNIVQTWSILREGTPDLAELQKIGENLREQLELASSKYAALVKMSPDSVSALRSYGTFLATLARMPDKAQEYFNRADRIEESISRSRTNQVSHYVFGALTSTMEQTDEQSAVLTLSAERSRAGEIITTNATACRLVGAPRADLIGRNVSSLFCQPFSSMLEPSLRAFVQKGHGSDLQGPHFNLCMDTSGSLVPVRLQITEATPSDAEDLTPRFAMIMQSVSAREGILLCEDDTSAFSIIAACPKSQALLGLDAKIVRDQHPSVLMFFPEIISQTSNESKINSSRSRRASIDSSVAGEVNMHEIARRFTKPVTMQAYTTQQDLAGEAARSDDVFVALSGRRGANGMSYGDQHGDQSGNSGTAPIYVRLRAQTLDFRGAGRAVLWAWTRVEGNDGNKTTNDLKPQTNEHVTKQEPMRQRIKLNHNSDSSEFSSDDEVPRSGITVKLPTHKTVSKGRLRIHTAQHDSDKTGSSSSLISQNSGTHNTDSSLNPDQRDHLGNDTMDQQARTSTHSEDQVADVHKNNNQANTDFHLPGSLHAEEDASRPATSGNTAAHASVRRLIATPSGLQNRQSSDPEMDSYTNTSTNITSALADTSSRTGHGTPSAYRTNSGVSTDVLSNTVQYPHYTNEDSTETYLDTKQASHSSLYKTSNNDVNSKRNINSAEGPVEKDSEDIELVSETTDVRSRQRPKPGLVYGNERLSSTRVLFTPDRESGEDEMSTDALMDGDDDEDQENEEDEERARQNVLAGLRGNPSQEVYNLNSKKKTQNGRTEHSGMRSVPDGKSSQKSSVVSAHTRLLRQVLQSSTAATASSIPAVRHLRWVQMMVALLVIGLAIGAGTQIEPLRDGLSLHSSGLRDSGLRYRTSQYVRSAVQRLSWFATGVAFAPPSYTKLDVSWLTYEFQKLRNRLYDNTQQLGGIPLEYESTPSVSILDASNVSVMMSPLEVTDALLVHMYNIDNYSIPQVGPNDSSVLFLLDNLPMSVWPAYNQSFAKREAAMDKFVSNELFFRFLLFLVVFGASALAVALVMTTLLHTLSKERNASLKLFLHVPQFALELLHKRATALLQEHFRRQGAAEDAFAGVSSSANVNGHDKLDLLSEGDGDSIDLDNGELVEQTEEQLRIQWDRCTYEDDASALSPNATKSSLQSNHARRANSKVQRVPHSQLGKQTGSPNRSNKNQQGAQLGRGRRYVHDQSGRAFRNSSRFVFKQTLKLLTPLLLICGWLVYMYVDSTLLFQTARTQVGRMFLLEQSLNHLYSFRYAVVQAALDIPEREEWRALAYEEERLLLTNLNYMVHGVENGPFEVSFDALPEGTEAYRLMLENACVPSNINLISPDGPQIPVQVDCASVYDEVMTRGMVPSVHKILDSGRRVLGAIPQNSTASALIIISDPDVFNAVTTMFVLEGQQVRWTARRLTTVFYDAAIKAANSSSELQTGITVGFAVMFALIAWFVLVPIVDKIGRTLLSARILLLTFPEEALIRIPAVRKEIQRIARQYQGSSDTLLLTVGADDASDEIMR